MLLWDEDEYRTILFHSVIYNSVITTYKKPSELFTVHLFFVTIARTVTYSIYWIHILGPGENRVYSTPRTQSPFLPSSHIISLPSFALTYLVYLEISLIQGYLYSLLKIWIVHFVNGEKYILVLFHFFTLQHAHPVHDHCMLHIISELCISTPPEVILLVADLRRSYNFCVRQFM